MSSLAKATPAAEEWLASVVINQPLPVLDYRIPAELVPKITIGQPVLVPLRKRRTSAYVVGVRQASPRGGMKLCDIEGIDLERPPIPAAVIDLVLFAARYYLVSEGEMLAAALPALARPLGATYLLTTRGREEAERPGANDALLRVALDFARGFTAATLEKRLGCSRREAAALLRKAAARELLVRREKRHGRRLVRYVERTGMPAELMRRPALQSLLASLPPKGEPMAVAQLEGEAAAIGRKLKALEKLGLVKISSVPKVSAVAREPEVALTCPHAPTAAQAAAIAELLAILDAGVFRACLLEGVTGSGKTEVYLHAIAHALRAGKSALVLVPEIALTPQLGEIFKRRFGPLVAIFHSGLTAAERRDEWERVAYGKARIGLGARSALFLPLRELGLIVVDEEHESTFKQEESPRYNARDLAVVRAEREHALVVLGSATPSFESRANAESGRYAHLFLRQRVCDRELPRVELVDLARAPKVASGVITAPLAKAIERTLGAGEQAIIYLNRRGFAPYVFCEDCGHTYRCVECAVSLTWHRHSDLLVCHHCGYSAPLPDECAACHGHKVTAAGCGVEKLERDLRELFGEVGIAKLDRDTVRTRGQLIAELDRFRAGAAKLLVGTQMVTKGHDFPGVTLVGVISADASLNFPDFRAAERTFQLLTQVAGRAGRGERPGLVLVQAYEVEHYAILAASRHDYDGFIEKERLVRRELGYPPYTRLALLRFEGPSEEKTMSAALATATMLRERAAKSRGIVTVLGPAPAPITRLRGLWRVQVLVKSTERSWLRRVLAGLPADKEVRQIIDVDPYGML